MNKLTKLRINLLKYLCIILSLGGSAVLYGAPLVKVNLCNDHDQKVYAAIAYNPDANSSLMSRGWWGVDAKSCNELEIPVVGDRFLVFANSESLALEWSGSTSLCIDGVNKFDFSGADDMRCEGGSLKQVKFKELSVRQLAATSSDGVPKVTFKSVDAVSISDVFRFCNDSNDVAYIAYGQKSSGPNPVGVAGWYKISPNKCYETLKAKDSNELYLYANNERGDRRWKGDIPLCVNSYDKFNFIDPLNMNCQDNNQRKQLFKKISAPAGSSFEYHLKDIGSETVRSMVELCNKSTEDIVVALAYENSDFIGQHVSSGWFSIKVGECSKALPV